MLTKEQVFLLILDNSQLLRTVTVISGVFSSFTAENIFHTKRIRVQLQQL